MREGTKGDNDAGGTASPWVGAGGQGGRQGRRARETRRPRAKTASADCITMEQILVSDFIMETLDMEIQWNMDWLGLLRVQEDMMVATIDSRIVAMLAFGSEEGYPNADWPVNLNLQLTVMKLQFTSLSLLMRWMAIIGSTHSGCGVDAELLQIEGQLEWNCSLAPSLCGCTNMFFLYTLAEVLYFSLEELGRMRRKRYEVLLRGVDLAVAALGFGVESILQGLHFHRRIEGPDFWVLGHYRKSNITYKIHVIRCCNEVVVVSLMSVACIFFSTIRLNGTPEFSHESIVFILWPLQIRSAYFLDGFYCPQVPLHAKCTFFYLVSMLRNLSEKGSTSGAMQMLVLWLGR